MAEQIPNQWCEGGCRRHWTIEWVNVNTGRMFQLCHHHSPTERLHGLGFVEVITREVVPA